MADGYHDFCELERERLQALFEAESNDVHYPSPDVRRLVFNRRLEAWPSEFDTSTYRRQVCWLDL